MFTVTEFTLLHQRIQSRAKPCFPTLSPKSASINPINPIRSSVCVCALSCSVMSDSLQPHELQHARPPCPSPTPGVHPNPCPLSR